MKTGQIVRFRLDNRVSELASIPREALGTVVCAYRVLANQTCKAERIDVDFKSYGILWAQPADAFEPLPDERIVA